MIQRKIINCKRKIEDVSEDFALSPRLLHFGEETETNVPILLIHSLISHMCLSFVEDLFKEAVCAPQLSFSLGGLFVSPRVCRGLSSGKWGV